MERKEIEEKTTRFLVDEFEIEEDMIHPEAKLRDDLGIDSLELVDIVVFVEQTFGFKIKLEELENIVTLAQFCDEVARRCEVAK